jgi:hypothetical protein
MFFSKVINEFQLILTVVDQDNYTLNKEFKLLLLLLLL